MALEGDDLEHRSAAVSPAAGSADFGRAVEIAFFVDDQPAERLRAVAATRKRVENVFGFVGRKPEDGSAAATFITADGGPKGSRAVQIAF